MTYPEFIEEWRNEEDYCLVNTSGSTGNPKTIHLPKELMRNSAKRSIQFFKLSPGTHIHSCISPDFIGGKMMAVREEIGKLQLSWEKPSNNPTVTDEFKDNPPALISLVPSQMNGIIQRGLPESFKNTIWLIGGSPVPEKLRMKISQNGLNAWESYGMTETASHIALRRISGRQDPFSPLEGIKIDKDERGCLIIELGGTKVVTNDLVDIKPNSDFNIIGRVDNVIITGGKKVHPECVESRIRRKLEDLGVTDLIVTSSPDDKWGERIILILEKENYSVSECRELQNKTMEICRNSLHRHEVPKEIRIVSSLPRTGNGKIKRQI